MNDTLIIKLDTDDFEVFYNESLSETCDLMTFEDFYQGGHNVIVRNAQIIRSVFKYRRTRRFDKYKRIIVFEQPEIAAFIQIFSGYCGKVYLWLWNLVSGRRAKKISILKKIVDIYTFDEGDAEKYKLKWNIQFYPDVESNTSTNSADIQYSLFFIGRDKGRKHLVYKIESELNAEGIASKLVVISNNDTGANFMDYSDVIRNILSSRAVLDLCQPSQTGLTVRTLEALAYQKKLVTNNKNVKKYKFYNPETVFVINDNDISGLTQFLSTENVDEVTCFSNEFSIKKWLSGFN